MGRDDILPAGPLHRSSVVGSGDASRGKRKIPQRVLRPPTQLEARPSIRLRPVSPHHSIVLRAPSPPLASPQSAAPARTRPSQQRRTLWGPPPGAGGGEAGQVKGLSGASGPPDGKGRGVGAEKGGRMPPHRHHLQSCTSHLGDEDGGLGAAGQVKVQHILQGVLADDITAGEGQGRRGGWY